MKNKFDYYIFIDYSEKFREKSYKDRVDNADINTGYDPQTGAAVEEAVAVMPQDVEVTARISLIYNIG